MKRIMRINKKRVVITGGGSGLGKAMALYAAQEGADIVLADISEAAMESTAAEIRALGRKAVCSKVDVCDGSSIQQMLDKATAELGGVDALINSAGVFSSIPFLELTEADWDKMLDVNLKGSFLCSQLFIKQLLAQKTGGSLLFISSISGYIGFTKSAHYCASKGAVRQLSKALALEFGPNGIRSNVIAPGTIETPMNAWIMDDPAMKAQSVGSIPLGRFGKVEEVAAAAIYLISDEASFCSGSELLVDGGQITHC